MATFIMLVGLPGVGKSTYIEELKKYHDALVICSSDSIRKELYGDESVQDNPGQVFEIMRQRTLEALKNSKDVIYDATNISRKHRISILKQLPKNTIKECYIIWARVDTCILRDGFRLRTVGADVINRMCENFQTPYFDEGWDSIKLINTDIQGYELKEFRALLARPHDNPHHPGTIQEHINKVCDEVVALQDSVVDISDLGLTEDSYNDLMLLAKYHDVGKAWTKTFINSKNEKTEVAYYYNHQNVGAYITLGLPSRDPIYISYLVNLHMEPFFNTNGESKFWKIISNETKNLITIFNSCDIKGA